MSFVHWSAIRCGTQDYPVVMLREETLCTDTEWFDDYNHDMCLMPDGDHQICVSSFEYDTLGFIVGYKIEKVTPGQMGQRERSWLEDVSLF